MSLMKKFLVFIGVVWSYFLLSTTFVLANDLDVSIFRNISGFHNERPNNNTYYLGEEIKVSYTFESKYIQNNIQNNGVDLAIIIDISASMANDDRINDLKAALNATVSNFIDSSDVDMRISFVLFDKQAIVDSVFYISSTDNTSRKSTVKNQIASKVNSWNLGSGTSLSEGLRTAYEFIETAENGKVYNDKYTILMTDGEANSYRVFKNSSEPVLPSDRGILKGYLRNNNWVNGNGNTSSMIIRDSGIQSVKATKEWAKYLKNKGYHNYFIGFNIGDGHSSLNEISYVGGSGAVNPGYYYYQAEDYDQLRNSFEELFNNIKNGSLSDVILRQRIPNGFELLRVESNMIGEGGVIKLGNSANVSLNADFINIDKINYKLDLIFKVTRTGSITIPSDSARLIKNVIDSKTNLTSNDRSSNTIRSLTPVGLINFKFNKVFKNVETEVTAIVGPSNAYNKSIATWTATSSLFTTTKINNTSAKVMALRVGTQGVVLMTEGFQYGGREKLQKLINIDVIDVSLDNIELKHNQKVNVLNLLHREGNFSANNLRIKSDSLYPINSKYQGYVEQDKNNPNELIAKNVTHLNPKNPIYVYYNITVQYVENGNLIEKEVRFGVAVSKEIVIDIQ